MPAQPTQVARTWHDVIAQALRDCGYLGIGQAPTGEDMSDALTRAQDMIAQWERQRWLIYHLLTYTVISNGRNTPYFIGPNSPDINTNQAQTNFALNFAPVFTGSDTLAQSVRPNRLESVFFRQILQANSQGPLDLYMRLVESKEEYNRIALKGLTNFGLIGFYDPTWPYGSLYSWPWPIANLYSLGITVRAQLPNGFALADQINLPFEYYQCIVKNLALQLRVKYGIPNRPGDELTRQAKASLNVLRSGNIAIGNMEMPQPLQRPGLYDIFSDQNY